jgi:predicted phage terminase large subunit-like protein
VTVLLLTADQRATLLAAVDGEERKRAEERRAQLEARCRDSFAAFFRAGFHVIEGSRLVWGKHLQAQCDTAQAFAEGWLVAHGHGSPAMLERQRGHWAAHGREMPPGACGLVAPPPDTEDAEEDAADPFELLVDHLVVNGGPGTLKSRIWMVYLQAWVWLHAPEAHFLGTSGSGKNVTRDTGYTKELVTSGWYRDTFRITWRVGVTVSGQVIDSTERWANSAGGERISIPYNANAWTGQRADFLLIDDPNDAQGVWSESDRAAVRHKYDRAIGNRLRWGAVTLVLQQHVHADDLSSMLKTRGLKDGDKAAIDRAKACGTWSIDQRKRWAAFVLPVEFRPGRRCTTPWGWTDWRTEQGEVLFKAMFTPEYIAGEVERLGVTGWEAQGNQNPEHAEGGDVQRRWLRFCVLDGDDPAYRARPRGCWQRGEAGAPEVVAIGRRKDGRLDLDWLELHVDPKNGSRKTSSSNVGLVVVGGKGNQRFILDDRTRRLQFLETVDAVKQIIRDWAPRGLTAVVVEFKAQGEAVIGSIRREIAEAKLLDAKGKPIVVPIEDAEGGSTSFEERWHAVLPSYRAGLVHVLDGAAWAEDHIDEVCSVPNGAHDDRADATCQAINRHADQAASGAARRAALVAFARTAGMR